MHWSRTSLIRFLERLKFFFGTVIELGLSVFLFHSMCFTFCNVKMMVPAVFATEWQFNNQYCNALTLLAVD
jgi:hypothetical protein